MTNSIRQMLAVKVAKRADAVKVLYSEIHVEPGFNLRLEGPELRESVEALAQHIIDGGTYPPLELRVRDAGGMYIVDGHRRHAAIGLALERGAPLEDPRDGKVWIPMVLFEGNDADRTARIITSAANKPLTPLEIAEGYKRLRSFGWAPAHIAKKVGKSAEHVQQLLALGDAPAPVREMVTSGKTSASHAAKTARQLGGDQAAKVLEEQFTEAKAQGEDRITPKTIGGGKTSASQARADSKHLDFLINEGARVCQGSRSDLATPDGQHGYWLEWPSGATQPGIFETARLAIDTAIKQQITT
ncbi:ParB/RepB/Spo0J family partition protein [Delftia sp. CH05]|uniref:ParB/RepB/Spo0J family partition protein n=1 Tax=Delftia sp. CH05 TaxID=2692194 RepID=UPI00135D1064|nr:ParB N-terminal domain-containing protein [Delftia sp. CH05]MXN31018.1 hypothetical protein [Delftia sp. CH05]